MANPEIQASLDFLVIDEAGQMALAEAVASTRSTKNLILLGDPNQLGQPTRAAHPEGTDHSALDHVIGGHSVMPDD